jgi:hypothetical protein
MACLADLIDAERTDAGPQGRNKARAALEEALQLARRLGRTIVNGRIGAPNPSCSRMSDTARLLFGLP